MAILMICAFCSKETESVDQAIELGWLPDFWAGEVNYEGPICPECCQQYLATDEHGEHVLKPGCAVPPGAIPSVEIEPPQLHTRQKFPLGEVVATPAALKVIEEAGQTPGFFLDRHVQGDWGEVDAGDGRANDEAVVSGDHILSAYRTLRGVRIWIITEGVGDDGQREATTILLPEQY
jgi:hypothetical protein